MLLSFCLFSVLIGFSHVQVRAFSAGLRPETFSTSRALCATDDRRSFLENLGGSAVFAVVAQSLVLEDAVASGGATAGGAYLLSAKQRYNERVEKGVTGFLGLRGALEGGDVNALRAWFNSEDLGTWKDFSAAGYLLANAFRRNSTASPDSLPSVKAWKGFAGKVEEVTNRLKSKDIKGAVAAYDGAVSALDSYLTLVELPASADIK